ncbi:MAG TPA: ABC transporter permease [Ruminococcaceae bacterium]|nr:ABC transporter permease [Oscillospiraceae bacterium]
MTIALAVVMIFFQLMISGQGKGSLFDPTNISNLISQNGYVVILATGMLLCILTGGNIDLAIGSTVALVSALAGVMIVNMKLNIYVAILVCLVFGALLGAWQAFWIAYMKIPSFIVTLAGMLTFRGLAWIILDGKTISPFPKNFSNIFNSFLPGAGSSAATLSMIVAGVICLLFVGMQIFFRIQKTKKGYEVEPIGMMIAKIVIICAVVIAAFWLLGQDRGIPLVLILLAAVIMIYSYYTQNTVSGRYLYAMGGNEKAARLSGVNTKKMMFFAYTNMGFLSAVAAMVCVARFNSAAPSAGNNYELDAIGACYIGGASAYGGVGTVWGAVIGAIFVGVVNNGMSILGIDQNWQRTVKGLVLLAAVIFDVLSRKRKQKA